jgi:pyruvate formate lyase activating enzyme
MPWHVTGFYPSHKMLHVPPTGTELLVKAREIGFAQGLEYVYTGNRPGVLGENTVCSSCKKAVIQRHGFQVKANHLEGGRCPHCGIIVPGVWE